MNAHVFFYFYDFSPLTMAHIFFYIAAVIPGLNHQTLIKSTCRANVDMWCRDMATGPARYENINTYYYQMKTQQLVISCVFFTLGL